jgi:RimJ/RimL family protein N-acetyltransferase
LPVSKEPEIAGVVNLTLIPIDPHADIARPEYASDDCRSILEAYREYYPKVGYHTPWIGYFVKREERSVGTCGFVSPPVGNRVEIAYGTFREFEGQGVATYASRALISLARQTDPALVITAKTAPEHNASTRILIRHGFEYSGIVKDHEIGDAWEWVLPAAELPGPGGT